MVISIKLLQHLHLYATDGEIGKIRECYFDDAQWVIRYIVVETGNWLTQRMVLLAPAVVRSVDAKASALHVALTRDQIKQSPNVDTALPVSRQKEQELAQYYQWPLYYTETGTWDAALYPASRGGIPVPATDTQARRKNEPPPKGDTHLRSTREVTGYHVLARDGELGHVADFLLESSAWSIQNIVVDTSNWWMGKKVLVAASALEAIDWEERQVTVKLTRNEIQHQLPYQPDTEMFL